MERLGSSQAACGALRDLLRLRNDDLRGSARHEALTTAADAVLLESVADVVRSGQTEARPALQ